MASGPHPRFTGWARVLGERPERGDRYKEWLYERHHADLRHVEAITAIVHTMASNTNSRAPN